MIQEGGLTSEQVATILNLPEGIDPLTFNPFEAGVDATKALEVEKVSQQIMTALSSFASAAEGAGADASDAFNTALISVVDVLKIKAAKMSDTNLTVEDKRLNFTKISDLNLIKSTVKENAAKLNGIDEATINLLVNDTTDAIKNVNDKIASVTDLTSETTKNIFQLHKFYRTK